MMNARTNELVCECATKLETLNVHIAVQCASDAWFNSACVELTKLIAILNHNTAHSKLWKGTFRRLQSLEDEISRRLKRMKILGK